MNRLAATLLAGCLLAGLTLPLAGAALAEVPLRAGARMERFEGGIGSALKAALAALASAVSGVTLSGKGEGEVPASP